MGTNFSYYYPPPNPIAILNLNFVFSSHFLLGITSDTIPKELPTKITQAFLVAAILATDWHNVL
jgi:hypothetical protein